ncbi:WD40-repeat-containing domain protein [Haematococcus lacustris]
MRCGFSRPDHSSPSPEPASVHDKLQAGQDKTGRSSGQQTMAVSRPSEQGNAAASAQPQKGSEAEEQRRKWAAPVVCGDEADLVFSAIKELLGSQQGAVDVQTLKVPTRTEAEVKLAQLSELGKVVVYWTKPCLEVLPFGPLMAAVIGGIYDRAEQAAVNTINARQLLDLVKECDRQLAKLLCFADKQQGGLQVLHAATQGMLTMAKLLVEAGNVIASYNQHGFLMRAIMSNSHKAEFERLDAEMRAAMQETCFAMTMELVITQRTYTDEMAAFRAAVCKAAGLPKSKAEQAVKKLQQSDPELLRTLLKQHGGLKDQVIVSELEALSAELKGIKLDIADVKSRLDQLEKFQVKAAARGPVALPKYLQTWWKDTVGSQTSVAYNVFLAHLVNWFKSQKGLEERLAEYDEMLRDERELPQTPDQKHVYLHCVVMPLMDKNKDSYVTRSDLNYLHQLGYEYAQKEPVDLPDLLDILYKGFDRTAATNKLVRVEELDLMCSKLQVAEVMRSYRIAQLLDEYHPGSRQKMYNEVNDWLNASSSSSPGGQGAASRLFLLLADAGMGKSVFSAVMHTKLVVQGNKDSSLVMAHHFFTVGHTRSQGRTMLLCLAQQLAEKLPGLYEKLEQVVETHGNATKLSMQDTFTSFLLEPLLALDKGLHPEAPRPFVLLLLDALDEADDGGRGWQPVTDLIAKEFLRLPVWVRVLLTARPQVEPAFAAWNPKWIKPEALQNQRDILALLKWRLGQGRLVADCDLEAAAQLMLEKSSGQFIYTKYAFDNLAEQETWTLQELKARLPSGLEGMYHRVLSTLQKALEAERPDLLELLHTRLLPVLVACLEPLTVPELAWATGCEADTSKVQQLVGLLANLFPCRPAGSDQQERVAPYHKSVLDWLTSAAGMSAGQFEVSPQQGHRLLASACLQQAKHCVAMCKPNSTLSCTDHVPGTGLGYSLRHAVAHACLSGDADVLQTLILEFGFWQATYTAGYGPDVLRDLMGLSQQAPAACQPIVLDVARWLRMCSNTLVKYPWAALQLARDAPHNSFVAKRAASLPNQPAASLLTKEDDWTACLAVLNGHELDVNTVATDGRVIASGSDDKTVRVWDVATGKCMHTLKEHTDVVKAVALSLDGRIIVSGSNDKTIRVWDVTTGRCIHTLVGHSRYVDCVALSPNGKIMFSGSRDKTLRVWDLATGTELLPLKGHKGWVTCLTVSSDGKLLASGSSVGDHIIRVWDMDTRKCKEFQEGHKFDVHSVAFNPDASILVSGSNDFTIKVWDMASGSCTHSCKEHTSGVTSVVFSPCGKVVVSGSADKTIRVWDITTGSCTHTLEGHTDTVASVAFSLDGQSLMSGSRDKTIRVWAIGSSTCTVRRHKDEVMSTALSTDGKILVSGSKDKTIRVWDLATGNCTRPLVGHSSGVRSVALSHDKKIIVSGSEDKTIKVWDMDTGKCKKTLDEHTKAVNCVALSPDAKLLVSGSEDKTIKVWDLATGKSTHTLDRHTHGVTCVTLSPNGKLLVSGSGNNTIMLWDMTPACFLCSLEDPTDKTQSTLSGHDARVLESAFSLVLSLATGNDMPIQEERTVSVSSLALSPDGRTLVSGSEDKTIRVWDLNNFESKIKDETLDKGTCKRTEEAGAKGKVALSSDGRVFSSLTANDIR